MNEPTQAPAPAEPPKRKTISTSKMKTYFKCGWMYFQRYHEKKPFIPTIPQHKGTSVHKSAEVNFLQKIQSHTDLSTSKLQEVAAGAFEERIKLEGLMMTKEEESVGMTRVVAQAKDRAVLLAGLFAEKVAPCHQPLIVEQDQRIRLSDEFDLMVRTDLVNDRNEPVDLKSGKRTLSQGDIDKDLQFTIEHMILRKVTGKEPGPVIIENMVDTGKTLKHTRLVTSRTPRDYQVAVDQINRFVDGVRLGVFLPAPKGSWWCSESACGFARECKYFAYYQKGGGDVPRPVWRKAKKKGVKA